MQPLDKLSNIMLLMKRFELIHNQFKQYANSVRNTRIISFIFLNFCVVGVNPYLSKLKIKKRMKNGLRHTKKVKSCLITDYE